LRSFSVCCLVIVRIFFINLFFSFRMFRFTRNVGFWDHWNKIKEARKHRSSGSFFSC
jgi:hypothetical protein